MRSMKNVKPNKASDRKDGNTLPRANINVGNSSMQGIINGAVKGMELVAGKIVVCIYDTTAFSAPNKGTKIFFTSISPNGNTFPVRPVTIMRQNIG